MTPKNSVCGSGQGVMNSVIWFKLGKIKLLEELGVSVGILLHIDQFVVQNTN